MSILYEALQKTQQINEYKQDVDQSTLMQFDDWVDVGLSLIIAILLGLLIIAHYPKKMVFEEQQTSLPVIQSQHTENIKPGRVLAQAYNPEINKHQEQVEKKVQLKNAEYEHKHQLNGIFISDHQKVALINDLFFNVGDVVDGMKIIAIETDHIKLRDDHTQINLKIKV